MDHYNVHEKVQVRECKIGTSGKLWDISFLISISLKRTLELREVKSFAQDCTAMKGQS